MKKALVIAIGLVCATSLTLSAADAKKQLTPEQKQLRKEMIEKYDTNKDGKLSAEEKSKISQEDKEKLQKAGVTLPGGGKKKAA